METEIGMLRVFAMIFLKSTLYIHKLVICMIENNTNHARNKMAVPIYETLFF